MSEEASSVTSLRVDSYSVLDDGPGPSLTCGGTASGIREGHPFTASFSLALARVDGSLASSSWVPTGGAAPASLSPGELARLFREAMFAHAALLRSRSGA